MELQVGMLVKLGVDQLGTPFAVAEFDCQPVTLSLPDGTGFVSLDNPQEHDPYYVVHMVYPGDSKRSWCQMRNNCNTLESFITFKIHNMIWTWASEPVYKIVFVPLPE